ncbi:MAG TPA: toprim domain-containing protein, partial [Anaerolineae bacterium]|nr:toprim domain-containing protein [Anaerolineae bacterium]
MSDQTLAPGEALSLLRGAGIPIVKERTGDGTEIRCCCPKHPDSDGHLYVNALTGGAFCQKCGLRTHINALCGHEAPTAEMADPRYEILAASAAYYRSHLSEEARRYLVEERCLLPEVLDRFQVGWAGGGLRQHLLEEKGFSADACVPAGVLKKDEQRGLRDYFYQRIMFPNTVGGRVVHLSGRALGDGKPKWCHLPGEIVYPFNADALRKPDCSWVEGILDVLSLACWDINAVAGLGTHAKPEWVERVPDQNRIIVTLDGDAAGSSGSLRVAELLGNRARIASLPAGKDPNDLLREGRRAEFEGCLRTAVDLLTFRINQVPVDVPRTELRRLLDDLLEQIAATDSASAEAYLGVVKERFHLRGEEVKAYRQLIKELRSTPRDGRERSNSEDCTYTALFDGLVDLVDDEGEPAFLVMVDGQLQVVRTAERDGTMLVPPPRESIPWLLPRADEVLRHHEADSDSKLYDDLVAYHRDVSELPEDAYYEFIAIWDLHTYLLEQMNYSPELCFFAVPVRGKSRTGKAIVYVSYRGIHVVSLREAYILRFASDLGGTIFFDIRSLWQKALREGSDDILLCRFERGLRVPRVNNPDRGPHRDTVYYSVFGPTVISTNDPIHHILDTRAVTIVMPETTRRFEVDVTPEAAQPLRERLVAFRARHLNQPLPEASKPAAGRLGDILRPLRQIVRLARPDRENAFLAFVNNLQRERLRDRAETLEAALLRILDALREEATADGLLPVRLVTGKLNEGRLEKDQVSSQKVGWRLRSLGFEKGRREEAGATIRWDEGALARAMQAYGLQDTTDSTAPTPETALPPVETDESVELVRGAEGSGAHIPPGTPSAGSQSDESAPEPGHPCYTCHGRR